MGVLWSGFAEFGLRITRTYWGSYSNITRPLAVKRGGEEAKVKEMVGTMEGEEGEGGREEKNVKG